MMKKMLAGLCGVVFSPAIGGCDEASLAAEEEALVNAEARAVAEDAEDEGAERQVSVDEELEDLAAPVEPAADPCSDQYMEYSHAFHACGTCPNGRVNNIMKRTCWGTGAWCPKECTGWEAHYSPCVPCD
ncbi:hypothetical protein SAMN02745121_06584 [Nannocystis exedens]|uniref:Uncharacterized protein n=1 Tax=Nannocystis exedens TaxID=54 RepID=A0A1I2FFQ6_9BACT|nr:hypothetical protein [Nannocystis exedens]PCC70497.1 hypothetical protein NAEX_03560 [Nannocystis exedens]SFF03311.1 hypothetical protein SAMN02745121_06584 [Nannocystis exedens]